MAIMTASAGEQRVAQGSNTASKALIYESIERLSRWLEENDYRGYDTFDGLSARFLRPFTFDTKLLRIVLQQSVRRLPVNLRPVLGITKERSSKGMGFLARGFMRLHKTTGDPVWAGKAEMALKWLIENQSIRIQRSLLGQPLRLPIEGVLPPERGPHHCVDIFDRPCVSGWV